jgi:uncharacterized protein DUF4382
MNKLSLYKIVIMLFFLALFTNCSDENTFQEIEKASISVKLFDAPGDYEKVYVEVVDVLLLVIDDKTISNCWLSLNAKAGVYDLLELTGGIEALLVDNLSVPTGMIYEIYLVLGDNNSIVTNGRTLPLFTPNALQKGLQIRVDQDLKSNLSYTFLLDFDVDQSILKTNTSDYIVLKPIIRSSMEVLSGSISGKISNTLIQTQVSLITNAEKITTFTDTEGNFLLRGIPEGNYTILITPDSNSGYNEITVNNISVSYGNDTDTGTIELN